MVTTLLTVTPFSSLLPSASQLAAGQRSEHTISVSDGAGGIATRHFITHVGQASGACMVVLLLHGSTKHSNADELSPVHFLEDEIKGPGDLWGSKGALLVFLAGRAVGGQGQFWWGAEIDMGSALLLGRGRRMSHSSLSCSSGFGCRWGIRIPVGDPGDPCGGSGDGGSAYPIYQLQPQPLWGIWGIPVGDPGMVDAGGAVAATSRWGTNVSVRTQRWRTNVLACSMQSHSCATPCGCLRDFDASGR